LIAGIVILSSSATSLWVSLPGATGVAKPAVVNGGMDAWIAVAITVSLASAR